MQDFCISLYAKGQAGGSGSLDMDEVILVPASEGSCHVTGCEIQLSGSNYLLSIERTPDERQNAVAFKEKTAPRSGIQRVLLSPDTDNYYLPNNDDVAVVWVGQRATSHVSTDTVGFNFRYNSRFLTLRGDN